MLRKFFTTLLILVVLAGGLDCLARFRERKRLGPGVALDSSDAVPVTLCDTFVLNKCRPGDLLRFRAVSSVPLGNAKAGDGVFADAVFVARIVDCGFSQKVGRRVAVFKFEHLEFPNRQIYPYKGAAFKNPEFSGPVRESGSLGMNLGKDIGPAGMVGGYVMGTLLPYYSGRFLDAPLNYIVGDVPGGTAVILRGYSEYIAFSLGDNSSPSTESGAARPRPSTLRGALVTTTSVTPARKRH